MWFLPIGFMYVVSAFMFLYRARVDLMVGVLIAMVDVLMLRGGTIKYPKLVFQEKEDWADYLGVSRWVVWHPFVWNSYR